MSSNDILHALADDELLLRLSALVRDVRRNEAALVAHLAEVDERRLYARSPVPSLFAYCTEVLHFSEPEACLRITVARASRRHPMLLAMLEDGRIHLSGVAVLAPHLTAENRDALLSGAVHRSKRHIEELVAGMAPRADVPDRIRRLPEQKASRQAAVLPGRPGGSASPRLDEMGSAGQGAIPASVADAAPSPRLDGVNWPAGLGVGADSRTHSADRAACRGGAASGRVEPLSAGRFKVQFTASAVLREKLERLQALMRAGHSEVGLAVAIEAAVDEKLARLEARRFGRTDKPRMTATQSDATARSRRIPAPIRRAVWKRDEGRCRFVDAEGRRCTARRGLEFHHVHPFGMGGQHRVEDLRLYCGAHNRHVAEIDYGRRHVPRLSEHPGASG